MACETITSSVDIASFQETICRYARYTIGKKVEELSNRDLFLAVTMAVRERLVDIMKATEDRYKEADAKRLYYLSMEFLMGRSLDNNLYNLGIYDLCREALISMGYDLEEVEAKEPDAALGNGGL
ncbi:MAG TPA: glycogen phosphorylase, partial [Blastocatellia bacterium]|nr:glycogen phosphorylase [Blastocatellia bacterium]